MIKLVIAALDVAETSRNQPRDSRDWPARFPPEVNYRNSAHRPRTPGDALYAAAAFRTGLRPDILTDTSGLGGASLLPYATRAAVMTIRADAHGTGLDVLIDHIAAAVPSLEP